MADRRVLVVTYPYPPMPSVGGNRWLAMSKYLRRAGHEVTILTTSAFGAHADDREHDVVRTRDTIAAPWLRALMRRPPLPKGGEEAVVDKPPSSLITSALVPDHNVATWVPLAAARARRLQRERGFECVITTSAYESTHLVALGMGSLRPPWIADFRDGWTFHPWKPPFPTRFQQDLDRRAEEAVVRSAERVVVVERPVGEDFSRRLGVDAAYVPNGWDPDLDAAADTAEPPPLEDGRFTLVHTGKLTGAWGRSPAPLFEALGRLEPEVAERTRLVLAGRLDRDEQEMIERLQLGGTVRHVGQLSRAQSLALQRRADALVLLTSPNLPWELPGKVFEYIGARRPILALADGNEAARVVEETGTGWTVPPADVEAIATALRRVARGELGEAYAPDGLERFVYPAPAEAMAEELERAIEARAAR